jgi:hypothetical protein
VDSQLFFIISSCYLEIMKGSLLAAATLLISLLVLPIVAFAYGHPSHQWHHQRPPASAPIPPSNPPVSSQPSGLCLNVAQEANPSVQTETPLMQKIKGKISCVRIADFGQNSSLSESLALLYKQNGFYVQIGNDAGTLSSSQLAQYDAGVIAEGKWAQSNGIDEVSVGNEQEYRLSGLSVASWIAHTKTLAAAVRQVYSGKISYSTSGDFVDAWVGAGGLGALDALGENDYCGFACNENYIKEAISAWGVSHVEVSETNCDIPNVGACQSDSGLGNELRADLLKLHAEFPSVSMYVFALQTGGDEPNTIWSLTNYPSAWALLGL